MRRDIKANGQDINTIRVEVDYNKGGYSYVTGREIKRGYYLTVSPLEVQRDEQRGYLTERYSPFTQKSARVLLKEVKRKSDKAEREAVEMAQNYIGILVEDVAEANECEVLEEV